MIRYAPLNSKVYTESASAYSLKHNGIKTTYNKYMPPFNLYSGHGITSTDYYNSEMTELGYNLINSDPKIYEFKQLKSKQPLFNNAHEGFARCEGTSCFHIEHMLSECSNGVKEAANSYHQILELKPTPFVKFKAAISSCCGARDYKYSNDDTAVLPMINNGAYEKMRTYQNDPQLLLSEVCDRTGHLHCYDTNFNETIHKALFIIENKQLDHMVIKVHIPRHVLTVCIFKCVTEEGEGYWVIPNEPNEAPYLPLKVEKNDILTAKLQFNNLFVSKINPILQDIPTLISLDCMVAKNTLVTGGWYRSKLGEMLTADNGKNRNDIEKYTVNLFLAGINSGDLELVKFGISTLKKWPKYAEELDLNNKKENGARINRENWGTYFLILAIECREHEIAKLLTEELGVNVNSRGAPNPDMVNYFPLEIEKLTTPLIAAIQKKDSIMVKTLINQYNADPLFPPEAPAFTYVISNSEISKLLKSKSPALTSTKNNRLILEPLKI